MTLTRPPTHVSFPPSRLVRRVVPLLVLPLSLIACVLSGAPWLRAFPSDVMTVPLVGTALLSVLLPVVVIAIGVRRLWLTALIDLAGFVFFTTLVTLREPLAVGTLWDGLVHGPSQILTFALPLVSPRTLLVAPIALVWLCGAIIGECVGRGWHSVLPYAAPLVTFGLAYAATTRAITSADDGRRYDTLLAAALLVTLLLLRAAQAWIDQDESAEAAQAEGVLPLRGLAWGVGTSAVVALVVALVVQAGVFAGPPRTASRNPPLDTGEPVTPLSFVAGLRPDDPRDAGARLFGVSVDRTASRYVALADVDTYDGTTWSFDREFRPSGGVVPADPDPQLRPPGPAVTQRYTIAAGPLAGAPWLPFEYRPRDVTGVAVNTDPASGMVVPRSPLRRGQGYTVVSASPRTDFAQLPGSAQPGTSAPPSATSLPLAVRRSIGAVVTSLQNETGTTGAAPLTFLRAVQRDFRANYTLSGGPSASSPSPSASSPSPSSPSPSSPSPASSSAATAPATPSPSTTSVPRTGGTRFAGVLASILGPTRAATPEQYATLLALLARAEGVPARVVTGFRIGEGTGATVGPGTYDVRAGQAWTWTEIPVQGRGWVVLDAAPTTYADKRAAPSASARPTPSPSPSITNALVTQAPADNGNAVAPPSDVPQSRTPSAALWLLAVGLVVALLVVAVAALLLRKRWRARRRRRGDARQRVIGAWQETLDVLAESGLPDLAALTSTEVAEAAAAGFGDGAGEQVRAVGRLADRAIFSPASAFDLGTAAAAWRTHGELRRLVRRGQSPAHRVRAELRYHRGSRRSVPRRRLRA